MLRITGMKQFARLRVRVGPFDALLAPPTITLSTNMVPENSNSGTLVGSLLIENELDYADLSLTLIDDAGGRFALSGKNIVVGLVESDYEAGVSHNITLQATATNAQTGTTEFTINVTNANEAPTSVTLSNPTIPEDASPGTVVGELGGSDPDASTTLIYTLVNTAGGKFAISENNIVLAEGQTLNRETVASYNIRVRASDGELYREQDFTILVSNVNENPSNITLSLQTVAENSAIGTTIGTFSTTDPDLGDTFTYTLTNDAGGLFSINGATLRVAGALNRESAASHNISVRSTDAGGLFTDKNFTITVSNVNENPTDISLSAQSIAEDASIGAVVGTFSTSDPDVGNTFTYTLTNSAGGRFAISGSNLTVASALNYENATSHSIGVRATDQGGLFVNKNFTITVTDVFEITSPEQAFTNGEKGFFYDISDMSTMWQDAARTTPVTGDNQPVGYIEDKSGNGYDLVQATNSLRPVFRISGSRRYLNFPSTGPYLRTAGASPCGLQTSTAFIGVQRLDNVLSEGIVIIEPSTGLDYTSPNGVVYDCGEISPQAGPRMGGGQGFNFNLNAAQNLSGADPILAQFNKINGGTSNAMIGGSITGTTSQTGTFNEYSNGRITIGRRTNNGAVVAGNRLQGNWFGAFHIDRNLTTAEANAVRSYMNAYID